ncbi:hypothetical protein LCL89_07935 [Halobacillus yeomjeoni]|uniref:hypothetical protein n=1 Tax=Halobacillus yeomjeoni TaxID=311194 RepID=UPI001CD675EF|nr:hypothetical protein [Halobacillus yeomjeoni]MCA0983990.1 hypothetical protein [Halobacillus yeomjeoni]
MNNQTMKNGGVTLEHHPYQFNHAYEDHYRNDDERFFFWGPFAGGLLGGFIGGALSPGFYGGYGGYGYGGYPPYYRPPYYYGGYYGRPPYGGYW